MSDKVIYDKDPCNVNRDRPGGRSQGRPGIDMPSPSANLRPLWQQDGSANSSPNPGEVTMLPNDELMLG